MLLTRDVLEARIAKLQADKATLLANLHATEGALQDCQYWLAEVEKAEAPKETEEGA